MSTNDVALTGIGVLSPIGNDLPGYWASLCEGKSGVGVLQATATADGTIRCIGGEVGDFKAKDYVKPRKNIKIMTRDIQLGFVAAALACKDAGLECPDSEQVAQGAARSVDPDRLGSVFGADLIGSEVDALAEAFRRGVKDGKHDFTTWGGAMDAIFPLWMLKHLPNMPGCHIDIALDARGPSNTVMLWRGSCLAAIAEGVRAIERGVADVMVCGAVGNRVNPDFQARGKSYELAPRTADPASVPRPFDADRCGTVLAEGAGVYVLERRSFAEARGARIRAVVRGFSATNEAVPQGKPPSGEAVRRAIRIALERAGITPSDLGHVNADGVGTRDDDRIEAAAIRAELGDVPVIAPKGSFGDSGAGAGAIELVASVLALEHGLLPPTRNCDRVADDCPINVVRGKPAASSKSFALKLNHAPMGRSYAIVLSDR